jgi:hypothetical protein
MKYTVVEVDARVYELIEEVNKLINEGWEPIGGVSVIKRIGGDQYWYSQALIKKD